MRGRLARFGAVGLAATAVHLGVAQGLAVATGWSLAACNGAGYLAAVALSFAGHHYWSFASARGVAVTLPRFLVLSALALAASSGVAAVAEAATDWPRALVLLAAALVVPPLGYLAARWLVF